MCMLKIPCGASLLLQNNSYKVEDPSGGLTKSWKIFMKCGNKAGEDQDSIFYGYGDDPCTCSNIFRS